MTNKMTPPPLPDTIVEYLRQHVNDIDHRQFEVGDYLIAVVDELAPNYDAIIGKGRGRAWIFGHIASRIGVVPATLRDREGLARFYPPDLRREWDMYSYHQLRAFKAAGARWREHASYWLDHLPAPVYQIRKRIKDNGELSPPEWARRWELVLSLCRRIVEDEEAPQQVRGACIALVNTII